MSAPAGYLDGAEQVGGVVWGFRFELAALAVLAALFVALFVGMHRSVVGAGAVLYAGGMVALSIGPVRRAAGRGLSGARVRRRWEMAVRHCDLRPVAVLGVDRVPAGDRVRVRVSRGQSFDHLTDCSERLAAAMGVRELRVQRDDGNASRGTVTLVRRDPLAGEVMSWPEASSLWDPIPLGIDEHGDVVTVQLPERNMLLGGEPGSGKSAALSMVIAAAALDPTARLWLFDGKLVELAAWEACAERAVGADLSDAISALEQIRDCMEARYRDLLAAGLRKVDRTHPLHLVVVDELALFTAGHERKQSDRFSALLRDLVARGRAAGIIVVAATQKPSVDVVPSSLRDLFAFRLALRCTTPQASDTVLGQGWSSQGYSAASVGAADRGVGFLLHESSVPVRLRTFYLNDDDVRALAARAQERRAP